jgi:hypothetical protein
MLKGRWYELRIIAGGGRVQLRQTALQRSWGVADCGKAEVTGNLGALVKVTFGAASTTALQPHDKNGRLEDPAILIGAHDGPEPLEPDKAKCLAWSDFSAEIPTDRSSTADRIGPPRYGRTTGPRGSGTVAAFSFQSFDFDFRIAANDRNESTCAVRPGRPAGR